MAWLIFIIFRIRSLTSYTSFCSSKSSFFVALFPSIYKFSFKFAFFTFFSLSHPPNLDLSHHFYLHLILWWSAVLLQRIIAASLFNAPFILGQIFKNLRSENLYFRINGSYMEECGAEFGRTNRIYFLIKWGKYFSLLNARLNK